MGLGGAAGFQPAKPPEADHPGSRVRAARLRVLRRRPALDGPPRLLLILY